MMYKISKLKKERHHFGGGRQSRFFSGSTLRKSFHDVVVEAIEEREERKREDEIKTRSFMNRLHTNKYIEKVKKEQEKRESFNAQLRRSTRHSKSRTSQHKYTARY